MTVVYNLFSHSRVAKDIEDKRSHYEPSFLGSVADENDHATFKIDEHDFVPDFQRVSISGEDTSGVSSGLINYLMIIIIVMKKVMVAPL